MSRATLYVYMVDDGYKHGVGGESRLRHIFDLNSSQFKYLVLYANKAFEFHQVVRMCTLQCVILHQIATKKRRTNIDEP